MTDLSITVVILTYNERIHIARAIDSVRDIATDILVLDSFSTDDTVAIASAAGARVLQNPFVNQSQQFQWALDHGDIRTDWILRLDADEVIEADLAANIAASLPRFPADVIGVNFKRKHIFMERWIKHGGRYPLLMLRLWRTGHGKVEDRWMDEHVIVWGGSVVTLDGGFADIALRDLTFFTDKHNRYATREAIEILAERYGLFDRDADNSDHLGAAQTRAKRRLKGGFYNKLPLGVGPLFYVLFRYFIQRGFLDGKAGLIYHVLQGFWYRFLVDAKALEFEMALKDCRTRAERIARLESLTGYTL